MTTTTQKSSSSPTSLKICCYGSSSKNTKEEYVKEAYNLGYALAQRGHICVNGAGAEGSMGAMNQGVQDGNGSVMGIIHKEFVKVEEEGIVEWAEGCHAVFQRRKHYQNNTNDDSDDLQLPITSLMIVGGGDLQYRKKKLVESADALIVLPGGPGTFDELWEMVCSKYVGFAGDIPIVCVNLGGYYDPFLEMLRRAHEGGMLYKDPKHILHFENNATDAIEYVEREKACLREELSNSLGCMRSSWKDTKYACDCSGDQKTSTSIVVAKNVTTFLFSRKAKICYTWIISFASGILFSSALNSRTTYRK